MTWAKAETDVARRAILWLRDQGWDIYQEVSYAGRAADIVAKAGKLLWVVECKMSLNLSVIEQANHWLGYAHFVSVAVPVTGREKSQFYFGRKVCEKFDIGVLEIGPTTADQTVIPTMRRKVSPGLSRTLRPGHKLIGVAGSSGGARWSAFKETAAAVKDTVWRAGAVGVPAKALVTAIKHHYSSPATALARIVQLTEEGAIQGVEVRRVNGVLRFFPKVGGLVIQAPGAQVPPTSKRQS